jgi:prophage regulatory protein
MTENAIDFAQGDCASTALLAHECEAPAAPSTNGFAPRTGAISLNSLVEKYVPVSKAQIYLLISTGQFPAPIKVGKSSMWLASEVYAWLDERKAERDAPAEPPKRYGRPKKAALAAIKDGHAEPSAPTHRIPRAAASQAGTPLRR